MVSLRSLATAALCAAGIVVSDQSGDCRNEMKTQRADCGGNSCDRSYSGGCAPGEQETSSARRKCHIDGMSSVCHYDVVCCGAALTQGRSKRPTPRPSSSSLFSPSGKSPSRNEVGVRPPAHYDAPREVLTTHRLNRFGRTSDFGVFLNAFKKGGEWGKEQEEYLAGITIGSIIIFAFAIIWFCVILLLRCLGQQKVGFLAGWFQHTSTVSGANEEANQHMAGDFEIEQQVWRALCSRENERDFFRTVNSARIVFFLCGGLLILSVVLFYTKGMREVGESLNGADDVIDWVTVSIEEVRSSIESILQEIEKITFQINNVSQDIRQCSNLTVNGRPILDDVNMLHSGISQAAALTVDHFRVAEERLALFQGGIQKQGDKRKYGRVGLRITVAANVAMMVLALYMMAQTFMLANWQRCLVNGQYRERADEDGGHSLGDDEGVCCGCCYSSGNENAVDRDCDNREQECRNKKCVRTSTNTLVLPLFIIILLLSWLTSSLTLVGAIAGADFCMMPDQHVLGVVEAFKDEITLNLYEYIRYYVSGCIRGASPVQDLIYEFDSLVQDSQYSLGDIDSFSTQDIVATCGWQDETVDELKGGVGVLLTMAGGMYSDFYLLKDLTDCSTVNPMYKKIVHEAICANGVGGLTWVFASVLSLAIIATLMLTLRAALRPVEGHLVKKRSAAAPPRRSVRPPRSEAADDRAPG